MIRLLVSDLRHHASSWTWVCVVAVVAGACVAGQLEVMRGAIASASALTDPQLRDQMLDAAQTVTVFCIICVVLAASTVLSSSAGMVISQRSRDHGLWRALGLSPVALRVLLLVQLAVVGAVGALGGSVLSRPVATAVVPLMVDQEVVLPGAQPLWDSADLGWCAVVVAGSVMLGGWGPARRAARAREIELMMSRREARRWWSVGRVVGLVTRLAVAGGCVAGVVVAWVALRRGQLSPDDAGSAAILGSFGVLVIVCVLATWLVPLGQRALTALPLPGPVWLVATRTAALESRRSCATVLPFLVAIGMVAVMFGVSSAGLGNMRVSGFVSMFGLAFITAWAGGVAVIAMSAGRRRRDAALLRAAGAGQTAVLSIEVLEGVLHAASAIVLGLVVSAGTSALLAELLGRSFIDVVAHGPWTAMGVVGMMAVTTTCLAVVISSRTGRREPLGQTLRARD
ncbi:FtsX-like permease family protein [Actinomyces faecalis]|uniref:FtsX-like permease family protein n=1 Tax=Actinomyces faecalis TaxID=2722820 RepID=UPI001552277E|nr:FtsX-like permease family protein [Actinomyces faecalis]